MKDDYLWDKSGTPDAEVEQLEQLLGTLRYRRPAANLKLPARTPLPSRRSFSPSFAIAAAALFMAITAGVWFALSRQSAATGVSAINIQQTSASDWLSPENTNLILAGATKDEEQPRREIIAVAPRRAAVPRSSGLKRGVSPESQMARSRRDVSIDEGLAAREQLIRALHLTSSKLNQVQKKVQDTKALGPNS